MRNIFLSIPNAGNGVDCDESFMILKTLSSNKDENAAGAIQPQIIFSENVIPLDSDLGK